jgi:hypothetical protein
MPAVSGYLGAVFSLPFLAVGYMLIMFRSQRVFKLLIGLFLLSSIFTGLYVYMRQRGNIDINAIYGVLSSTYMILLPISLIMCGENDRLIQLFWFALVCIIITEITSIVGYAVFPNSARQMVGQGDADLVRYYSKFNIAGYGIAYILPGVVAQLSLLKRKNAISGIAYYLFCGISAIFLIMAEFTLALLLFALAVIIDVLTNKHHNKPTKALLILGIAAVAFFPLFGRVLIDASRRTTSAIFSDQFYQLGSFLSGRGYSQSSDFGIRISLYGLSLSQFSQHVLLGNISAEMISSGHSAILDMIASYGLLGLALMFCMFRMVYRRLFNGVKTKGYQSDFVFIQTLFLLAAIVNPTFGSSFFFAMFAMCGATYRMCLLYDN